jgi:hypothetical protein
LLYLPIIRINTYVCLNVGCVCACVCMRESVCVYVSVCERERESVCVRALVMMVAFG